MTSNLCGVLFSDIDLGSFVSDNVHGHPEFAIKSFNLKKKLIPTMCKCMVSMATNNVILKYGGVTTKSFISQLLLSLDHKTWYQIQALA